MARKAAPKHVEPEDESQDLPEDQAELEATEPDDQDEPVTGGKAISKAEAIRRSLAAGHDGPQEGTAYIRREFGIEITPQHWSATRSQMKSRAAKKGNGGGDAPKPKGRPGRKPREAATKGVEGYLAPPPQQKPAVGGQGELLAAMEAMKPLVDSLGKDQVKRIVDLLG
ncbi:hypothetical protein [Tautonia plasticadhaerens]|uniref:Uncharacterized protein n=1 Tax=Tautonia plasticadhaerens TaxID=2527974 RepID=A0A518H206_9BACT|nr:hypothetical protein [Tautonia plasticadhaerens]QDV34879.1 hypothetical protein ElP_27760 [Tautonia plasticadhaerens]